jgi:alpha-L-fucosidase
MTFLRTLVCGFVLMIPASAAWTAEEAKPSESSTSSESPYTADWESLAKHQEAPEWFRDDKFGIYFHWGVYSVPAFGSEWYPRNMHQKGRGEYKHHVETYGDPTEFGYDKFVPMFKAEKFDAEQWADLFEKAGARFAGPVAEHHDGFAMWASKVTPWNAKDKGPQRDLTGELAEAIRKRGMKFVTSFHHARNNLWEKNGKWSGHYDGVKRDFPAALEDPERAILYGYMPREKFLEMWLAKLKEVIDNYQPDLIWFDSWLDEIPDDVKMQYLAYYFNKAQQSGKDVVVTFKQSDLPREVAVDDYEKGRADRATKFTWLTDDTISRGCWCYTQNLRIKPTSEVVHVLIDIVSKNGQLLLNISPKADGSIPDDQREVLLGVGKWLGGNGDAIYGTRPWVIFGEGPTRMKKGGHFVGSLSYSSQDIRFTTKGDDLYAIFLGEPSGDATIACLATDAGLCGGEVTKVSLAGAEGDLEFKQDAEGLHIVFPNELPCDMAVTVKIEGLKIAGFQPQIEEHLRGSLWQTERHIPVVKFRDGKAVLKAVDATLVGSKINVEDKYNGKPNIGFWDDASEYVAWKVEFPEAGKYAVSGRFAAMKQGTFQVQVGKASITGKPPITGEWGSFETVELGTIEVTQPGAQIVKIVPVADGWAAMNLSSVELRKAP